MRERDEEEEERKKNLKCFRVFVCGEREFPVRKFFGRKENVYRLQAFPNQFHHLTR